MARTNNKPDVEFWMATVRHAHRARKTKKRRRRDRKKVGTLLHQVLKCLDVDDLKKLASLSSAKPVKNQRLYCYQDGEA